MLINKYTSKTETYSVLDIDGNVTQVGYRIPLSNEEIEKAYYTMVLTRRMDEKMIKWQRQGKMLTFPPNMGEEALQVATSISMDKQDWFAPAFRSAAVFLHSGVPMWKIMLVWKGNEAGNAMPEELNFLPFNIPIGTQYSHAAGIGIALNYQNKPNVAYTVIGDGGTAEGEFYEALNFASVRNAQTIFTVNNNQWAISTPTSKETGQMDIASKAIAAGLDFIKVDGNCLFASVDAIRAARAYVLENKKPILVEFVTYRKGPHTTSDNPRIYRSEEYECEQEKKDPILRLERWMAQNGLLDESKKAQIIEKADAEVEEAYKIMESKLSVSVDDVFDHTFKTLDESLQEQKNEALKIFGGNK
ncbi:pyruvate dehydrogenase (acetyl-transferring) E1 component subunit alpha [Malacoplasma penetrans]|uniref:Pyruvate dehydrogenase E1 component subunit alpha n=1 Tax=Malacoplasma penetrans (strain HF-2) TaxID=272633 RepID=Q8EVQ2_MALP2|nr:pyruvate dehydrogenase (acetyl-transferring) E1 component subunit alpha [Malacoplasma penetrans]RXY96500.1 pyruvate dehydrogenase (acetyl-transferring) E1 component subunit alpha [Malacoplasma penetrans]BAC44298.1 pyruvate dehydrogenase E1 component subunit alpha [Malacoplasma penetrans HF-2]